jgi:hypothetical protein
MVPVSLLHHLDGPSDGTLDGTQVLLDVTGSMVLGVIKVSVVPHQWPGTAWYLQGLSYRSTVPGAGICICIWYLELAAGTSSSGTSRVHLSPQRIQCNCKRIQCNCKRIQCNCKKIQCNCKRIQCNCKKIQCNCFL